MNEKSTNLKVVERISSAVEIDSATLTSHIDRTSVHQALLSYVNHLNGINSLPEDEVNSLCLELASELSEIVLELEFGISNDEMYNEEGNYYEKFQDRFNELFGIIEDELIALDKSKIGSELRLGRPICKTDEYLSDEVKSAMTVKDIEKLSNLTTKGDHTFGEIDLTALEGYDFGINEKIRIRQSFGGPVEVYIGWFNAISRTWPCNFHSFDTIPEAMEFISEQFEAAASS